MTKTYTPKDFKNFPIFSKAKGDCPHEEIVFVRRNPKQGRYQDFYKCKGCDLKVNAELK